MTAIRHLPDLFKYASNVEKIAAIPIIGTLTSVGCLALKIFDQMNMTPQISFLKDVSFIDLLVSTVPFLGTAACIKKLASRLFSFLKLEEERKISNLQNASATKIATCFKKHMFRSNLAEQKERKTKALNLIRGAMSQRASKLELQKRRAEEERKAQANNKPSSYCAGITAAAVGLVVAAQITTYFYLVHNQDLNKFNSTFIPFNSI